MASVEVLPRRATAWAAHRHTHSERCAHHLDSPQGESAVCHFIKKYIYTGGQPEGRLLETPNEAGFHPKNSTFPREVTPWVWWAPTTWRKVRGWRGGKLAVRSTEAGHGGTDAGLSSKPAWAKLQALVSIPETHDWQLWKPLCWNHNAALGTRTPSWRRINNRHHIFTKTMKTKAPKVHGAQFPPCRSSSSWKLGHVGAAVEEEEKRWYSGLDSKDSSDLKLFCLQNEFPSSPPYKLLKAAENDTSIYFCHILQV